MKLLLADDHAMFRTAVADGLEAMIGGGTEVLEADTYDAAYSLLKTNPDVDVVLLDLLMPGFANFDGLGSLVRDFPSVPVVVLSGVSTSVLESGSGTMEPAAEAPQGLPSAENAPVGTEETAARLAKLTDRELQILSCLARGASNKQIARELGITDTTVKVHLRMIFKKLGVSNRTQAAFFARERPAVVA
jgi:two-component system nitrate/nitrite response regulator NarL